MSLDPSTITQYSLPDSQYIKEETTKTQIYLHHTAGNANGVGVYEGWKATQDRIATCIVISGKPRAGQGWRDGQIVQGFSSRFWAYHLGLKSDTFRRFGLPFKSLDKISVGIEICNWGQLTKTARGWETYVGSLVSDDEVCTLPTAFKGFRHFHSYTDAQIESTRQLLVYWKDRLGIPISYKGDEIFALDKRALAGEPGVYTHNSVRRDKVDVYPHPKLVEMLKSL
jgi:hypothetical protein